MFIGRNKELNALDKLYKSENLVNVNQVLFLSC